MKKPLWYHKRSRHLYRIVDFAVEEGTLLPLVIYRRADGTGPPWTRPCSQFFDGRFVQQFAPTPLETLIEGTPE